MILPAAAALLKLGVVVALIAAALVALAIRKRLRARAPAPELFEVLDLPATGTRGTFVVFTSPDCAPCKRALRVVGDVAEAGGGSTAVAAIDAAKDPVAARYGIKSVPTVLLVDRSGRVLRTWRDVPRPADAREAASALA